MCSSSPSGAICVATASTAFTPAPTVDGEETGRRSVSLADHVRMSFELVDGHGNLVAAHSRREQPAPADLRQSSACRACRRRPGLRIENVFLWVSSEGVWQADMVWSRRVQEVLRTGRDRGDQQATGTRRRGSIFIRRNSVFFAGNANQLRRSSRSGPARRDKHQEARTDVEGAGRTPQCPQTPRLLTRCSD